jgi:tetratricopeptide (TPR) repeat protein
MSHEEKLFPFDRGSRKPDPAKVAEFAATARKLQQEREGAAGIAARLLGSTPFAEWPHLAHREELRNSGALDELSREVAARVDRVPLESLAIAELSTKIADSLAADSYPVVVLAQIRAQAWKDRGLSLCYLARYSEALDAFDRAEGHLQPFGTLAHDRAIVRFARAKTLQEANRFDESIALLTDCKKIFEDHGDTRRQLLCGIAEGALLHRMARYREAITAYLELIPLAQSMDDLVALAGIHNNIGHSSTDGGDYKTAEIHLDKAVELYAQLGQPLRVAGSELARGRMLVRKGEIERGMEHLHSVREQYLRQNLVEEAGLCGLDIVEAQLVRGASIEAEAFAWQIVREFTAAQLNRRAITALGYLSEAIAARKASAATVRNVRHFINSLRRTPDAEFVATA